MMGDGWMSSAATEMVAVPMTDLMGFTAIADRRGLARVEGSRISLNFGARSVLV